MARKTKLEAEQTRSRILDAAERLFYEQGVGKTSLEEIAAAADVTRGAVYWHFRNKADLFLALHERVRLPQEEVMARAVAERHPDPLAVIEESILAAMALIGGDERRRRVFSIFLFRCEYVDEMEEALARQREVDYRFRCSLIDGFELACQTGLLDASWQPQDAALALKSLISGLLADYLRNPADRDLGAEAAKALPPLFRAFRAPPAVASPAAAAAAGEAERAPAAKMEPAETSG